MSSLIPPYWVQTLIRKAVKTTGSYDPEELCHILEEDFTSDQWATISAFLQYVHDYELTFGHNFAEVYQNWLDVDEE